MRQGTLDMIILLTLLLGSVHGAAIAKSIEQTSQKVLRVGYARSTRRSGGRNGADSPSAKWRASGNNRRARYYRLTALGRKQLTAETSKRERLSETIARILNPSREEV